MVIIYGIGKNFGKLLPIGQMLEIGRGVVKHVGIISGGIHAEAAVLAVSVVLLNEVQSVIGVHILRRGQNPAHKALMLGQRG